MPHGVFLHAAPKSSNNYSLLYKSYISSTPSRNILRCNHPLFLFSDLCAFTKSIRCNSYSLRTTAFLLLGKPPENSGTNYQARNQPSHKNSIASTQCTSPKVLAPNQGCSTIQWRSEGTNDSSGSSSDYRSWCLSHNFRPVTKSTLCKTFLMNTSVFSHAYQVTLKLWCKLYYRNGVLAMNSISTLSAPHQRCQQHIQGALLIKKNSEQTKTTSGASSYHRWWCTSRDLRPFTRSFLIGLFGLPFYNICRQASSTCPFTL